MAKVPTAITYLACLIGLVLLGRAIAIVVGSEVDIRATADGWRMMLEIGVVSLVWAAILLRSWRGCLPGYGVSG